MLCSSLKDEALNTLDGTERQSVDREQNVAKLDRSVIHAVLIFILSYDHRNPVERDVVDGVAGEPEDIVVQVVKGESHHALALVVQPHLRIEGSRPCKKVRDPTERAQKRQELVHLCESGDPLEVVYKECSISYRPMKSFFLGRPSAKVGWLTWFLPDQSAGFPRAVRKFQEHCQM